MTWLTVALLTLSLLHYYVYVRQLALERYWNSYHNVTAPLLRLTSTGRLLQNACFAHRVSTPSLAILTFESPPTHFALLRTLGLSIRHFTNADMFYITTHAVSIECGGWKQCLLAAPPTNKDDILRLFEIYYEHLLVLVYPTVLPYSQFS